VLFFSYFTFEKKHFFFSYPKRNMSEYIDRTLAGWHQTTKDNTFVHQLFSDDTIASLSRRITESLQGLDPHGRVMYVDDDKIRQVLSTVYSKGTRTAIGDIYTRDHIAAPHERDDLENMLAQTEAMIVRSVRNQYDMNIINARLNKWDTVLGESNAQGLRSHAPIKTRERHPQYMAFHMRY
jgi:hypothetical protein